MQQKEDTQCEQKASSFWNCLLGFDKWSDYFHDRGVAVPRGLVFRWGDDDPSPIPQCPCSSDGDGRGSYTPLSEPPPRTSSRESPHPRARSNVPQTRRHHDTGPERKRSPQEHRDVNHTTAHHDTRPEHKRSPQEHRDANHTTAHHDDYHSTSDLKAERSKREPPKNGRHRRETSFDRSGPKEVYYTVRRSMRHEQLRRNHDLHNPNQKTTSELYLNNRYRDRKMAGDRKFEQNVEVIDSTSRSYGIIGDSKSDEPSSQSACKYTNKRGDNMKMKTMFMKSDPYKTQRNSLYNSTVYQVSTSQGDRRTSGPSESPILTEKHGKNSLPAEPNVLPPQYDCSRDGFLHSDKSRPCVREGEEKPGLDPREPRGNTSSREEPHLHEHHPESHVHEVHRGDEPRREPHVVKSRHCLSGQQPREPHLKKVQRSDEHYPESRVHEVHRGDEPRREPHVAKSRHCLSGQQPREPHRKTVQRSDEPHHAAKPRHCLSGQQPREPHLKKEHRSDEPHREPHLKKEHQSDEPHREPHLSNARVVDPDPEHHHAKGSHDGEPHVVSRRRSSAASRSKAKLVAERNERKASKTSQSSTESKKKKKKEQNKKKKKKKKGKHSATGSHLDSTKSKENEHGRHKGKKKEDLQNTKKGKPKDPKSRSSRSADGHTKDGQKKKGKHGTSSERSRTKTSGKIQSNQSVKRVKDEKAKKGKKEKSKLHFEGKQNEEDKKDDKKLPKESNKIDLNQRSKTKRSPPVAKVKKEKKNKGNFCQSLKDFFFTDDIGPYQTMSYISARRGNSLLLDVEQADRIEKMKRLKKKMKNEKRNEESRQSRQSGKKYPMRRGNSLQYVKLSRKDRKQRKKSKKGSSPDSSIDSAASKKGRKNKKKSKKDASAESSTDSAVSKKDSKKIIVDKKKKSKESSSESMSSEKTVASQSLDSNKSVPPADKPVPPAEPPGDRGKKFVCSNPAIEAKDMAIQTTHENHSDQGLKTHPNARQPRRTPSRDSIDHRESFIASRNEVPRRSFRSQEPKVNQTAPISRAETAQGRSDRIPQNCERSSKIRIKKYTL